MEAERETRDRALSTGALMIYFPREAPSWKGSSAAAHTIMPLAGDPQAFVGYQAHHSKI